MSRYKILDQHTAHFVTLTIVDWVDVFIRRQYKEILLESLKYCQRNKGLVIYAYVIMASHIHLVVEAKGAFPLSDILRDFKKFTSKSVIHEIENGRYESRREWLRHRFQFHGRTSFGNRQNQLWSNGNHPIVLFSLPVFRQKIDYVHNNPVREGWVEVPEHYVYSSASNYAGGGGVLEVEVIDLPLNWDGYLGV